MGKGETIDKLVEKLAPYAASNQPIDAGSFVRLFVKDVIELYQFLESFPKKKGQRYRKKKEKAIAAPSFKDKEPFVDYIEGKGCKIINPNEWSYKALIATRNYLRHNT